MNNIIKIDFNNGICAVCRKQPVEKWCDYIIKYHHSLVTLRDYAEFIEANKRGTQYTTCDLPMCEDCAVQQGGDTHLCPHHNSLQLEARLPDEYQKRRQQQEKTKILREVLNGN